MRGVRVDIFLLHLSCSLTAWVMASVVLRWSRDGFFDNEVE